MRKLLIFLLALALPRLVLAAAAQETDSYLLTANTSDYREAQLLRCNDAASPESPTSGEVCESDDWTKALDCRGMKNLTIQFHDYDGGNILTRVKIWQCMNSVGFSGMTEDPSTAPTVADTDPLCVDLTASAGVTIDGEASGGTFNVQLFSLSNLSLGYIIGEIDVCNGGNCDSTLMASCSR